MFENNQVRYLNFFNIEIIPKRIKTDFSKINFLTYIIDSIISIKIAIVNEIKI